jgi:pimeloyl-ACP methyl ester carboxylesterase
LFIELVEVLRCIREHDESWLVASIDELRERSIYRGTLGCPVCGAEYPVEGGIADFSGGAPKKSAKRLEDDAAEIAARAGGFLALAGITGVVVLGGSWGRGAAALADATGLRIIAANAADDIAEAPSVALLTIADSIPLGAGSCAGVALDDSFSAAAIESAQRAVRPGGRIVGPKRLSPPAGINVLAEDESWWVGEKPPEVTTLRRGNR